METKVETESHSNRTGWFSEVVTDIFLILAVVCVAGLGALVSGGETDLWYASLNKSELTPPGWVFGVVWPTLYFLMIVSIILFRHAVGRIENASTAFGLFFLQLALNLSWSVLFFFFHRAEWALMCILALVLAVAVMIWEFAKHSKGAAILQIPYLLWISFASWLNASILWLN